MGMSIDEHIGVIEDLKSTMSVCMPDPEKTEICTSLSKAIDTMRKYKKIQEVMEHWGGTQCVEVDLQTLFKIREVLEDGNGR